MNGQSAKQTTERHSKRVCKMTAAEAVDFLNVWGEAELRKAAALSASAETAGPSIYSSEYALRQTVEQAIRMIDAAKKHGDPSGELLPALRRTLRGGLVAADALSGAADVE